MSTATELLRRALDYIDQYDSKGLEVYEEIEAYLAAEPEAEPVFIRPDYLALARKSPFLCQVGPVQVADFVPLYTRPEPARKPMTKEEIWNGCEKTNSGWFPRSFAAGVRFAEKHHGIGINPSDPDSIDLQSRCRGDKL